MHNVYSVYKPHRPVWLRHMPWQQATVAWQQATVPSLDSHRDRCAGGRLSESLEKSGASALHRHPHTHTQDCYPALLRFVFVSCVRASGRGEALCASEGRCCQSLGSQLAASPSAPAPAWFRPGALQGHVSRVLSDMQPGPCYCRGFKKEIAEGPMSRGF